MSILNLHVLTAYLNDRLSHVLEAHNLHMCNESSPQIHEGKTLIFCDMITVHQGTTDYADVTDEYVSVWVALSEHVEVSYYIRLHEFEDDADFYVITRDIAQHSTVTDRGTMRFYIHESEALVDFIIADVFYLLGRYRTDERVSPYTKVELKHE